MDGLAFFGCNTALFWALVSVASMVITWLVVTMVQNRRIKKRLRDQIQVQLQQVKMLDPDEQLKKIEEILAKSGYAYDENQEIYYSVMNPWQREMGYCRLYDQWAPPLGMVFDSEPVRFNYNGKKWLIEFWKGQYGITVGGEIGIYNTAMPDALFPGIFTGTFYHCASDDEMLDMEFTLKRNDAVMFTRADKHWWLTGFVLGEYSDPSRLTMEASVTFRDLAMRDAFTEALRKLGYNYSEIWCFGNTVMFTLAAPRSKQPSMRRGFIRLLAMQRIKALVSRYRELTKDLDNMYGILLTLKIKSPVLYRLAVNLGKKRQLFTFYRAIRKFLT